MIKNLPLGIIFDVDKVLLDSEAFNLAAKQMHLQPEECLVIEDAINGVRAAKASGGRCLALTTSFTKEQLFSAGADRYAENLAGAPKEVLAWL